MNMTVDGVPHNGKTVQLANDLQEHFVELIFAHVESPVSS